MSLTIKNYKRIEGWAHQYKDFRIDEIVETETEYAFRIEYNLIPYTIKIFRNGTTTKEYEIVLRDGLNVVQFGRQWIKKDNLQIDRITDIFEKLIVNSKPKAKVVNNPFYSNGPF
jgi:hypothetical protein